MSIWENLQGSVSIVSWLSVTRHVSRIQLATDLCRRTKELCTCPINHSRDTALRGHVFCSFLELVLQMELVGLGRVAGMTLDWHDLIREFDRL